jgi:hypothetical protein
MKKLGDIEYKLAVRPPKGKRGAPVRSEWNELVKYFTDKANAHRLPSTKEWTPAYIARRLSTFLIPGHSKKDYSLLYVIKKKCEEADNWNKMFWYLIRQTNETVLHEEKTNTKEEGRE